MKAYQKYLILALAAALFGSCAREEDIPAPETGSEPISFHVAIPGPQLVTTRGVTIPDGAITSLYVLVFDQDGNFLSRTQAVRTAGTGQYQVKLKKTDQSLPAAQKKRTIHFICNYDWTGWFDAEKIGLHENEVVGDLFVSGTTTAYWQRSVLTDGISATSFPSTVELIRNVAKVTMTGQLSDLSDARFAVGNRQSQGLVAPYNTTTQQFDENTVTESSTGSLQPVTESSFILVSNNMIECYERKNSTTDQQMYAILRGQYTGTSYNSYYKVEFRLDGAEEALDIQRCYHYQINISTITGPGARSLQEAIDGPAGNALLYTVVPQEYGAISDGISGLYVGYTSKTLVQANTEYTIPLSYYPQLSNEKEDNTNVTCTFENPPGNPVIASGFFTKTPGNASYTFKTVGALPAAGRTYTAKVIVRAITNGMELRRDILLDFRRPAAFGSPYITPDNVPTSADQQVVLSFTIPEGIAPGNFPMEVFITSTKLSPDKSKGQLSLDYSVPGTFRYKYMAPGPGEQQVYFTTAYTTTSETLRLEADIFTPYTLAISN